MEKWFVATKKADFDKWSKEFHISPVVARILRNRDLVSEEEVKRFLYGSVNDLYSPWFLKDMEKAVDLIEAAIIKNCYIRVIGDYDVDGICSSYILTKGLQSLGAKVDTAIPHRIHDGYGLNDTLIEEAKQDKVEMIVTCDNGIAAASQIALAKELGIEVIVTDHHEVPFREEDGIRNEILPPAAAIVDPKQQECSYPYKNICGGVVAYKLMCAMLEKTKCTELSMVMDELLEFAAFATVCDVMELKDENRIIVKEGLKRLKNTENQGIKALMEVNGIEAHKLSAYHLGFVLGPCLNATGRLDTAKRALELLQSTTKVEAMSAAKELKDLNDSRKGLTQKGVEEAEKYIEEYHLENADVMVIYLPEVHESLAGIIAGRIREKYNHPVFVLTKSEEGVKGSGRSIETYHMYEEMTKVKQFFTKYGGHKLAAGLSMKEEDVEAFREALNRQSSLTEDDFIKRVHIDVPMPLSYATEELARELEVLEPFGVENPKPLFAQKELKFVAGTKIGSNKNFARFRVCTPEGEQHQLLFFGNLELFSLFLREKYGEDSEERLYSGKGDFLISVVYQLGMNTYRGKTELQFIMQHYC